MLLNFEVSKFNFKTNMLLDHIAPLTHVIHIAYLKHNPNYALSSVRAVLSITLIVFLGRKGLPAEDSQVLESQ